MARYFVQLSYKGTNYHGWQYQPNALSVQQILNEHFSLVLGEKIELTGAGRTDTGVHASYYMAHFDSKRDDLAGNSLLLNRLNAFLPVDIALQAIIKVRAEAHARFDASSRTYEYRISRKKDPFLIETSYFYPGPLNLCLMQESCDILLTINDFSSFCKKGSAEVSTLCKIGHASWREEASCLIFKVIADRFLRNMVRAMVGTQLALGRGKLSLEGFQQVLESRLRSEAGDSVPGKGLTLCGITYPEMLFEAEGLC